MTEVVVQLWLPPQITGLQSIQAVVLHFLFGYWEFCDYLLLILAWMLILYLMTLSEGGGGGGVFVCVWVRVELILSLALFSNSCFLIKRNEIYVALIISLP